MSPLNGAGRIDLSFFIIAYEMLYSFCMRFVSGHVFSVCIGLLLAFNNGCKSDADQDENSTDGSGSSDDGGSDSGGEPVLDGMANLSDRGTLDTRGLKAFPGAEGGGQDSNGGRGGELVIVNTTDCSDQAGDGKVSWKEAWQASGDVAPGDRTVVFSVGGLFDCGRNTEEAFVRAQGELTVACQTAPPPGVNIAAFRVEYKGEENVIMRGCQFLSHDISGDAASMFRVVTTGSSSNIIVDRVTGLHGPDDFTMAFISSNNNTDTFTNITLSNSIIAEGDAYSTHSEAMPASGTPNRYQHSHGPGCSAGVNVNGRQIMNCSFVGNLMAHNNRRNPKFWNSSGQVIGNMMYNPGETGAMVLQRSAPEIDVWLTDNFVKFGPNTDFSEIEGNGYRLQADGRSRVRMERNKYQLANNGAIMDEIERLDTPAIPEMTFQPLRDWTEENAFDCLGAKHRDANVDRIIEEVKSATGEIGIGSFGDPQLNDGDAGRHWLASEGGDPNYYTSTAHPDDYDTDNDGMADEWEEANGLIVGTRDHNDDLDGDGYTNVEEFANSLLRCK